MGELEEEVGPLLPEYMAAAPPTWLCQSDPSLFHLVRLLIPAPCTNSSDSKPHGSTFTRGSRVLHRCDFLTHGSSCPKQRVCNLQQCQVNGSRGSLSGLHRPLPSVTK